MDYFNDVLTTFLGLERVICVAVYGGFGTTWGWVINDRISFWVNCPFKKNLHHRIVYSDILAHFESEWLSGTSESEFWFSNLFVQFTENTQSKRLCPTEESYIQNIKAALFHTVEVNGDKLLSRKTVSCTHKACHMTSEDLKLAYEKLLWYFFGGFEFDWFECEHFKISYFVFDWRMKRSHTCLKQHED